MIFNIFLYFSFQASWKCLIYLRSFIMAMVIAEKEMLGIPNSTRTHWLPYNNNAFSSSVNKKAISPQPSSFHHSSCLIKWHNIISWDDRQTYVVRLWGIKIRERNLHYVNILSNQGATVSWFLLVSKILLLLLTNTTEIK